MSSEADDEGIDLFREPVDFYEPEKQASFASHKLLSGQGLTVRLVGHNPLWVSYDLSNSTITHFVILLVLRVLRLFFTCSRIVIEDLVSGCNS
jgi:hypothetical protein